MLRREGWAVNAKRVYRLYTADDLAVRTKVRKRIALHTRVPAKSATRPNEKWSMDFVVAWLLDGRWLLAPPLEFLPGHRPARRRLVHSSIRRTAGP